jgi:hypothetical protein
MPRNASGTYSLPTAARTPGSLIRSADYNTDLTDVATALTSSLPVNGSAGMSGPLLASDGTAAVPGIAFLADKKTGFYRTGAGQFTWVSGGIAQAVFGTAGLTINGTLGVTGATSLGDVNVTGTLATANISATNLSLSGSLTPPLSRANGGTPVYVNSAATTGSANAQALATGSTIPASYSRAIGSMVAFDPGYTNTGPLTLDDGAGAVNVYKQTPAGAAACFGGEVVASQLALAQFDGTQFQLLNTAKAAGFGALTSLASGATTDLGTIPSQLVYVTGTTTITSFGSSASVAQPIYLVRFDASLQITYNGGSLITPTGANITTQSGDLALCQYLGSSNWKILQFTRANPSRVNMQSFDVAGAATYTPTAGCVKAHIRMIGGGGAIYGTGGGTTSVGSWSSVGGASSTGAAGGAGGAGGVNGTGIYVARIGGGSGTKNPGAATFTAMVFGGGTPISPVGSGYFGCGADVGAGSTSGGGGGGGEYAEFWLLSPPTTSVTVGAGGVGSAANGSRGLIIIEEFFQ